MDFALKQKLASIEADLVSASAFGGKALLAEIQTKIAELDLAPDERFAVLDMLTAERETKEAEALQGGAPIKEAYSGLSRAMALGTLAAGVGAAKMFANKRARDEGWENLHYSAPDVIQADPHRAEAMYDMLHSTAPNLAQNPVVAGDLMKQMSSMPMIDLGTVHGLADTGRSMQSASPSAPGLDPRDLVNEVMPKTAAYLEAVMDPELREIRVPVAHVTGDGIPCAFNWATEAMKEAGITDAFSGGGTLMDQADNAFNMNEQQKGLSMLPLDSVVRELLSKEQELMQREDILAQQEQQVQQALQQIQQMQGIYQDQYGMTPEGQMLPEEDPAGMAPPEEGAMPMEGEMPPEEGTMPMEGEMPPEEGEMPPEEGAMPMEGEMPPEEGTAPAEGELPPEEGAAPAEGELPPEEGAAPDAEDPGIPQEGAGEFPLEPVDGDGDGRVNEGEPVDGDGDGMVNEGEENEGIDDDAAPELIDGDDDGVVAEDDEGEGADDDGVPGGEQEALPGEDPTVGGTEEADASGLPPEMGESEITPAPEEPPMDPAMDPMGDGLPPEDPMAEEPPLGGAMDPAAAAPAAGAPVATPTADGGMEMTIPLPAIHVSVKMAEEMSEAEKKQAEARDQFAATIEDLFRP